MSFTFTVSPLSHVGSVDVAALKQALGIPADQHVFAYAPEQVEPFVRRATPDQITRWWAAVEDAHVGQLSERVRWDETSGLEVTRDIYSDQDLDLQHIAAFIDRFGTEDLAARYAARPRPAYEDKEMQQWMRSRGSSVRFPQVIVGPDYYLPFKANLILSVPDWTGKTTMFGSLPRLLDEYDKLLDILAKAGPRVAELGSMDEFTDDPIAGAYNAGRIHRELTALAVRNNLPKWFSE